MFAPRPTLVRPKSGTPDITDRYEYKMLAWRDSVMRQAAQELASNREFQEMERYIDYLEGTYWDPSRPAYKSNFYDNYMMDQRREALAALSDIRPALDISSKIEFYESQASISHQLIRSAWYEQAIDLKVVRLVDHALFGSGYLKIVAYEPGAFQITAHGSDSVLPVMKATDGDLQTAQAVVYRGYQTIPYFQNKFGTYKAAGLERFAINGGISTVGEKYDRPGDIPEYTWNAMSPPMRRRKALRGGRLNNLGAAPGDNPFPVVQHLEIYSDDWTINDRGYDVLVKHPDLDVDQHNFHYIAPNRARMFPRKRLVVFAGDKVMYDGPAPFWSGLYPFIELQLNPAVWSPGGISKYRDLAPLVKSVNRIGAGIDESVIASLNRNVVGRRGTIAPTDWDRLDPSRPNQKILLNGTADPTRDLRWMDPPQVPAYVGEFLKYLVDSIKRRSGSLDITGLSRKKQAPGGDAIENMRDAMSAPFRLEGRYVEHALVESARQAVSHCFQFFTHDQRLRYLGENGQTWEDFDYKASSMLPAWSPKEDHWKKFSVNVAPGSMHGSSKQQRKVEAFTLYRSGGLSLQGLYRALEYPDNVQRVMEELAQERKSGIGIPAGRTPRQTRSAKTGGPLG